MTTTEYFLLVAVVGLALLAVASAAETVYHWMFNQKPGTPRWVWWAAFSTGLIFTSFTGAGAIAIAMEVARR